MARIFLLDGTALAYRAHFALARSGLAHADGQPTGAAYGFTEPPIGLRGREGPGAHEIHERALP